MLLLNLAQLVPLLLPDLTLIPPPEAPALRRPELLCLLLSPLLTSLRYRYDVLMQQKQVG